MTSALFMPAVDVAGDGTITCDWGSSLINWTDDTGHLHEDDMDPEHIAYLLDEHLRTIREAIAANPGDLADLVRPFFVDTATP